MSMSMATSRRDVSINLGLYNATLNDIPKKRQSLLRTWRRLSSLQRSLLLFLLGCCLLTAFLILPGHLSDADGEGVKVQREIQENQEARGNLGGAHMKGLEDNLMALKEKAKKDIENDLGQKDSQQMVQNKESLDKVDDKSNAKGFDVMGKPKINTERFDYFNGQTPNTRQQQVMAAFRHAWQGYKKYAWGKDELLPISKTHSTWFGCGLTLVDALDTMVIMGLKEEYEEAKAWVTTSLTFDVDSYVNLFEITIRMLGALLSTWHLTGDQIMKDKAMDLGTRLLPAFNHKSKIPYSDVNLAKHVARAPKWGPDSSTSEVTTIQLEFRELSKVTGDPKYEDAVNEVSLHIHELPKAEGLVPIFINAQSGQFRSSGTITLGARGDSYYEYLLKQWVHSGGKLTIFKDDFMECVEGIKHKLLKRSEPGKLLYIGELLSGRNFSPKMDHLVCFMPGTLALAHHNGLGGGEFLTMAEDLTRTCWEMYARTATKLSPEIVFFNNAPGSTDDLIIKPLDSHNLLRPETVESLFYMWRFTGDQKYRDWGWAIFLAFEKHTKVPGGYSSISNVRDAGNPRYRDKMESFFLSETLKYFYLLFSDDPELISLDKWVFNTEAHPFPIAKVSQGA